MTKKKKTHGSEETDWGKPSEIMESAVHPPVPTTNNKDPLSEIKEPPSPTTKDQDDPSVSSTKIKADWGDDAPPVATPPPQTSPPKKTNSSRNWILAKVFAVFILVALLVLSYFSWQNSRRYFVDCDNTTVSAEKGSFWPYGVRLLDKEHMPSFEFADGFHCENIETTKKEVAVKNYLSLLTRESKHRLSLPENSDIKSADKLISQGMGLSKTEKEYAKELTEFEQLHDDACLKMADIHYAEAMQSLKHSKARLDKISNKDLDAETKSLKNKLETMLRDEPNTNEPHTNTTNSSGENAVPPNSDQTPKAPSSMTF